MNFLYEKHSFVFRKRFVYNFAHLFPPIANGKAAIIFMYNEFSSECMQSKHS